MSEPGGTPKPVVEVLSGDDSDSPLLAPDTHVGPLLHPHRRVSIIEVESDASDDESVEIVNELAPLEDDVEITSVQRLVLPAAASQLVEQHQPPRAPRRRRQPSQGTGRNVRQRFSLPPPRPRGPHGVYPMAFLGNNPELVLLSNVDIPDMLLQHQRALFRIFQDQLEDVLASIMDRINREDERTLDRKMELENMFARKLLRKKQQVAEVELDGYTNNITADANIMCELCGITLGEGIPADFEPNPELDDNLVAHAAECHVNAPWFCIRQCFDGDRELLKRVFAAKCGHVFCGRCIKNIGSRPPVRRGKAKEQLTILNPQVSAPRKCPARDCGVMFNKSKRTFTELFI